MISVIIAIYNEPSEIIEKCILSLENQKNVKLEIIILDQKGRNKDDFIKPNFNYTHSLKYIIIPDKSLSFARNYGIEVATNNYIAFIDPDAFAEKYWALSIVKEFKKDSSVGIVGGKILPEFLGETHWYHKSFYIWSLYSLIDLGSKTKYVKKVIGANFAVNKELIGNERFREDLGRRDGKLFGGEETDFCERIRRKFIKIKYIPDSVVYHHVSKERLRIWWILKRSYYGGISRGIRGGIPEVRSDIEHSIYDIIIFPLFLIPYLFGLIQGRMQNQERN